MGEPLVAFIIMRGTSDAGTRDDGCGCVEVCRPERGMGSRSVLGRDIGEKRVVAEGARLGSYGQPGVSVSRQRGGVGESKQTERTLDG